MTKPAEPTRDVRPLERAIRLVQAEQALTILEAQQALLASGYLMTLACDRLTGRIIVRVVNPRGQESTFRVPATEHGLKNALAQVTQAHQPGPVIAPISERSGR
jgi:hypothetical protein